MNNTPLVSILCATFNQKEYIAQAIESFLMQKVNFSFEIIIHDDASTDGTADIVREYAKKYPDIIKPILQSENQHSKKNSIWKNFIYSKAKGKYLADCEGDDYWTDPNKLQRQVDFLENNPDYVLSTENANILFTATGVVTPFSDQKERDISIEDLLIRRRFATASAVYRSEFIQEFLNTPIPAFDTNFWAFLAKKGKIHYNSIISSVYRRGPGVTENNKIKWAYTSESINKKINEFYKPSKKVRKARARTLYFDFKNGWKAARKQNKPKDARKLFCKMLYKSPTLFVKDIINTKGKSLLLKFKTKFWNIFYNVLPATKLKKSDNNIVISLTSYPARFQSLHICLKSLLNQTLPANKIILYLSKDIDINTLPKKILRLQKKGLVIDNHCEDIKPHKKYFYAMRNYPNSIIVTADDDVIYPRVWLASLYSSYQKHPHCISARRVHRITRGIDSKPLSYALWDYEFKKETEPSMDLMAIGVGGVLYPPHIFNTKSKYFDISKIKELCLTADDIWLKFIEKEQNINVCWVPNHLCHPYKILNPKLKQNALCNANLHENVNDIFISNCSNFFETEL